MQWMAHKDVMAIPTLSNKRRKLAITTFNLTLGMLKRYNITNQFGWESCKENIYVKPIKAETGESMWHNHGKFSGKLLYR